MTLSGHFEDQLGEAVKEACSTDPKPHGAISRWIVEASRQRLQREGLLPGNKKAELMAAIEEVGVDQALDLLTSRAR